MINMNGDLLSPALGGDMLSAHQLRASAVASKADEVLGHKRHGTARALFPGRVGRRVDDDLTDDSPARVVGIATRDEKPRERLCDAQRSRLGPVAIQMP
jgi:hypothetical protein